jgi:photosystem II stability/assembly factor-like uncharacterized protein
MAADGQTMYVTDAHGNTYVSTDAGGSWSALTTPPLDPGQSVSATDASANGGVLISAVNGGPVYISTDGKKRKKKTRLCGCVGVIYA